LKSILLLILLHLSLFAHPHTFVDLYPTIKVQDNKITSLRFTWVFDEMTSSMLIMDLDTDMNQKIDTKENNYIYNNYFQSLADYGFYTFVTVNSKRVQLPEPTNFKANIKNHRISYSFDIVGSFDIRKTSFEFGDRDLYVAMVLKKEFVHIEGATPKVTTINDDRYFGYKLELQ